MAFNQATLRGPVRFSGVGLHSGKLVNIIVKPVPVDYGIVFERIDLNPVPSIPATLDFVVSTTLCTSIGLGSAKVSTIEHLLAAFSGLGVDNALVQIDGEEVPILDGSSAQFVEAFQKVGVLDQDSKKKVFEVSSSVRVGSSDSYMNFAPHREPSLVINCSIDFPRSRAISHQKMTFKLEGTSFKDIVEARTFCHIDDVNFMREKGLALGGSFDNAVVVDHEKVLNKEGLRYGDEFVRHKILDCIGDLALLGRKIFGTLDLHRGGHTLHLSFVRAFLEKVKEEASQKKSIDEKNKINALEKNLFFLGHST